MIRLMSVLIVVGGVLACGGGGREIDPVETPVSEPVLEVFAETDRQWTGIAVSEDDRVLVNFPRWWPEVVVSVAEVIGDGSLAPFPNAAWNNWGPDADPASTFVCVQSVVADGLGSVWVLDPANPWFQGVVPGGAKLVQINLASNEVARVITFDDHIAPLGSYLNDVRIDPEHQAAYITDSGAGALVVVNLATGSSRRVLDGHPSTSAEDTVLTIEGEPWLLPDGSAPQVHADGIAYDPIRDLVYYQALTGRTLYRLPGSALRDPSLDESALAGKVEAAAVSGPSDGLLWDGVDGILISAIEDDAVKRWSPAGGVETVVADPRIAWPDSFAFGRDGVLYVTTSQIHRGANPPEPYRILRISSF
jgi:sugar lactone lactonase YvrE